MNHCLAAGLLLWLAGVVKGSETCGAPIRCSFTETPPLLDGAVESVWDEADDMETLLIGAIEGDAYRYGAANYKCLVDTSRIYILMKIPGEFRFDAQDNHKCAAIAIMFQMGSEASFYNMGGCPQASKLCLGMPSECENHKVDIGSHWELADTEQREPFNFVGSDKVAVSPKCRFDDSKIDNYGLSEWSGAWAYESIGVETFDNSINKGEVNTTDMSNVTVAQGSYIFELSRSLITDSAETDKQLGFENGETYNIGFAFWDPHQDPDSGWDNHGHYVTGCGKDWITMSMKSDRLADTDTDTDTDMELNETSILSNIEPFSNNTLVQSDCIAPMFCSLANENPVLDGVLSEWTNVTSLETELHSALQNEVYPHGLATFKCQYNTSHLFLSMKIPASQYRFDPNDDHKCASVATMWQLGSQATFYEMGGCPKIDTSGCKGTTIPNTCQEYKVDIGGHWEISQTKQGVMYSFGDGNLGDEVAASPYCRLADENGVEEWAGAWSFEETSSSYIFELSRSLTTDSPSTDVQLSVGNKYKMGFAFWDPNAAESGWDDPEHYVTGCGAEWIDLVLVEGETQSTKSPNSSSCAHVRLAWLITIFSAWYFV